MQFRKIRTLFGGAAAASVLAVVGTLAAAPPANAANTAPVANPDNYSTHHGVALHKGAPGVLANDTDADHNRLTAVGDTLPAHGKLTLSSNGAFTYTPKPRFVGTDTFTYKAFDGIDYSKAAVVTITVTNTRPVAVNDAYTVRQGTALVVAAPGVLANDKDADGDKLTATKVVNTLPGHGTLSLAADGGFKYTPAAAFVGMDKFTYRAYDGAQYSKAATVTITVTPNHAPVAANDSYSTMKNQALVVAAPGVLSNDTDADKDTLTAVKVTDPAHGTLSLLGNGGFTYTPVKDFVGDDSFTYKASDGQLSSNVATVSITVKAPAPAPAPATLFIRTSKGIITFGQGVTVQGTLTQGAVRLPSQTVALQRCALLRSHGDFVCGPWTTIKTAVTNGFGIASVRDFPSANARYRWVFAGTSQIAPATSRAATVFVRTAVVGRASAHVVARHHKVTLFVTVRPNHAGQHVILQRFIRRIGWVNSVPLHLTSHNATTSKSAITLRLKVPGTNLFRFVKPADANHATGVSNTIVIHVR